jgi:hypothetical protein
MIAWLWLMVVGAWLVVDSAVHACGANCRVLQGAVLPGGAGGAVVRRAGRLLHCLEQEWTRTPGRSHLPPILPPTTHPPIHSLTSHLTCATLLLILGSFSIEAAEEQSDSSRH